MKQDPIVRLGDRHKSFRIRFWEYFRPEFLASIVEAVNLGDLPGVEGFAGIGHSRLGEALAFHWRRGEDLAIAPTSCKVPGTGHVEFFGDLDYWTINRTPGIEWLRRLSDHFDRSAWLNPEPRRFWRHTTVEAIAEQFPMFPLTLQGLDDAVSSLVKARRARRGISGTA